MNLFKSYHYIMAVAIGVGGLLLLARAAEAHPIQMSPIIVDIYAQKTFLTASFTGSKKSLFDNIPLASGDIKGNDYLPSYQAKVEKYLNQNFELHIGKTLLKGQIQGIDVDNDGDTVTDKFHVNMRYPRAGEAAKNEKITIQTSLFNPSSYTLNIITMGGFATTLDHVATITIDPSELAVSVLRNIRDFMLMGINHIFTGPDHMLFIVGLLMVSTTLRGLIKTLTGFTIAHSITLALSALNIVHIDAKLCDILIAVSIIYVGVENMFHSNLKNRFWVASGFGLIHGFGFSDTLRDVGLPPDSIGWCLMSFNMGVEVAQVIICCITFPLLMLWRRDVSKRADYGSMSWPSITRLCSAWVVFMGAFWLYQRTLG